jgi:hypothetical protein
MLELSPPLPIFLLLRVAGLSGLNTISVDKANVNTACTKQGTKVMSVCRTGKL